MKTVTTSSTRLTNQTAYRRLSSRLQFMNTGNVSTKLYTPTYTDTSLFKVLCFHSNNNRRLFLDVRCAFAAANLRLSFLGVDGHTRLSSKSFSGVTGESSCVLTARGVGRFSGDRSWWPTVWWVGWVFSRISFRGVQSCDTDCILFGDPTSCDWWTDFDFFGVLCVDTVSWPLGEVTKRSRSLQHR